MTQRMTGAFSMERRDNDDFNDMMDNVSTKLNQCCFNFVSSLTELLYVQYRSFHWMDTAIDNVLKELQMFVCVVAFDDVNDMINNMLSCLGEYWAW